jgi:hypothetical protein
MKLNNFTYATISIDDLPKVDFNQIKQTSNETIRRSVDYTQFVISWDDVPSFIEDDLVIPIGTYTHAEILDLMLTEVWTPNEE